jgi:WD40 repeat protein
MQWSPSGAFLAIIQEKSTNLLLWDVQSKQILPELNTNLKHLNFICWSPQDIIACGTGKGNLILYNKSSGNEPIAIMGKHTRSIHDGVWNQENVLALVSDDHSVTFPSCNHLVYLERFKW